MSNLNQYIPYVKPDYEIHEDKEIIVDKIGNMKIVKKQTETNKSLRAEIKRVIIIGLIFIGVCAAIIEPYRFMTTFTPNKWEHEFMRPLIFENLKDQTKIDFNQKSQIDFDKDVKEVFGEDQGYRTGMVTLGDEYNSPYNLYFRTPEAIHEFLGEANPKNYAPPELPIAGENEFYEAYYCYGNEEAAKWIIIKYEYGLVYEVTYKE